MQDELLPYYERELRFIRRMAADFAVKYPAVASRLELGPDQCEDPHVDRLIQAFALLTARVRHKIDDEFPEITEALLGILYPHYLRPIPSMSIVQFALDRDQSSITAGYPIPKGAELLSKPVTGVPVEFRTCYPVTLWPLEVGGASFVRASALPPMSGVSLNGDAFAAIRIELQTVGAAKLSEMSIPRLRFYLNGDSQITYTLHELILNNALQVVVRGVQGSRAVAAELAGNCLRDVGFGEDEGLLPYDDRSFLGYRLLQEYFSFPEKFLFFDVDGCDILSRGGWNGRFELIILLNEFGRRERLTVLERSVNADTFQLGCAPAVNLFQRQAEPIRVTEAETEYRVIADRYHETLTEIYSIDRVVSSRPNTEEVLEYQPFYSFRHSYVPEQDRTAFWIATRRPSFHKGDKGSEVYLSLVDLGFRPAAPPDELLTLRVTCTNRDLPAKLPFTGADGEFEMESGPMIHIRCRRRPTEAVRPVYRRGLQWRLISHLALNNLSIMDGREAFQEILNLYDFSDDPVVRRQIAGITGVSSAPHMARVTSENGSTLCLGTRVEIEFDEDQFVGTGAFLMASVLERFMGLYSSINSFSQLCAKTRQRKGLLKLWPPRAAEHVLV
jgi:type VI secretion system protein ImpG